MDLNGNYPSLQETSHLKLYPNVKCQPACSSRTFPIFFPPLLGPFRRAVPMNSAGSYVQESSRKQGPKGMKGKTRHVTSTPPSPTNTQTHASFVVRSRRSSGMLIQLAQLAKPKTKQTAGTAAEIIVFPTVLRSWRAPIHCPPRSHEWKAYFFLGVERFYFFLTDPMAASPRDIWMAQAPLRVFPPCALSLRWHWLLGVVSLIGLTACQ